MVRLVFRPYTQVRRTICTSLSLRGSTRVSFGFALLRYSSPSFGSRQVCSHSNSSQKIEVDRSCTPWEDHANQLPCTSRVYLHTYQTPWFVLQDGSNGELASQYRECTCVEVRRGHALSATIKATAFRKRVDCWALAVTLICAGPRPKSIDGSARHRSTSDRDASPTPIRFSPDNFKQSLTLFSKFFLSFPCSTCYLLVSRPYLALDGIYCPIGAAFPNNPTRRQRLVVR
ncbi:Hypothetical predicted protein [Olea europaea subsp. europaea]|uniref:Uncharacterized protein n=1 Tax=Olea europaea subsp. europaea TaxID=158383 RepID=A0A8S0T2K7_OLEEU|nr:Hypothetical predicted protein [Olea europaea subsp. europaea]